MKLVEGFDSNYRYVLVAARRARQIQNGARPVVQTQSRKPCRIAEEEIQAGMVKWTVPAAGEDPAGSRQRGAGQRHRRRSRRLAATPFTRQPSSSEWRDLLGAGDSS